MSKVHKYISFEYVIFYGQNSVTVNSPSISMSYTRVRTEYVKGPSISMSYSGVRDCKSLRICHIQWSQLWTQDVNSPYICMGQTWAHQQSMSSYSMARAEFIFTFFCHISEAVSHSLSVSQVPLVVYREQVVHVYSGCTLDPLANNKHGPSRLSCSFAQPHVCPYLLQQTVPGSTQYTGLITSQQKQYFPWSTHCRTMPIPCYNLFVNTIEKCQYCITVVVQ